MVEKPKAVVLLSGGLDSTTVMAIAHKKEYDLYPLTVIYGQRHQREIESAKAVAEHYGVADRHIIVEVDSRLFKGSSLTENLEVPSDGVMDPNIIPNTYVPGRNTLLLSHALSYAESIGASFICYGANALDYSGYPDCRPQFVDAYQNLINMATKQTTAGNYLKLEAPLMHMTKAEISAEGLSLEAPLNLTWSCYKGGETPCGVCDSCRLRAKGFDEIGKSDPALA